MTNLTDYKIKVEDGARWHGQIGSTFFAGAGMGPATFKGTSTNVWPFLDKCTELEFATRYSISHAVAFLSLYIL